MNTEDAARQGVKVNDSAPTTNLQVRLADGSRSVPEIQLTMMIMIVFVLIKLNKYWSVKGV